MSHERSNREWGAAERPLRDPCVDMQHDISALVDKELDAKRQRRVLVHLEVCPKCNGFLQSLRAQVALHREIASDRVSGDRVSGNEVSGDEVEAGEHDDPFAGDLFADYDGEFADSDGAFTQQLVGQSDRLGEVLYQLGRAYISLVVSPEFFRILSSEPVPIPEYRLRGKALVDGFSRVADQAKGWTQASELLNGELDSEQRNLVKGQRLLQQSLVVRPDAVATSVWLAQCLIQRGRYADARDALQSTLDMPRDHEPLDPVTRVPLRCYALETLGNLYLFEERPSDAIKVFDELLASGAIDIHPNFSSTLLNIAFTSFQLGKHERAIAALIEFYERFPQFIESSGRMIVMRPDMQRLIDSRPGTRERLAERCPLWFDENHTPKTVQFQIVGSADEGHAARRADGTETAARGAR